MTDNVETVVLLSQQKPDDTIHVGIDLKPEDVTAAESKATYDELKAYIEKKYGFKVSNLYIAQEIGPCRTVFSQQVGPHLRPTAGERNDAPLRRVVGILMREPRIDKLSINSPARRYAFYRSVILLNHHLGVPAGHQEIGV